MRSTYTYSCMDQHSPKKLADAAWMGISALAGSGLTYLAMGQRRNKKANTNNKTFQKAYASKADEPQVQATGPKGDIDKKTIDPKKTHGDVSQESNHSKTSSFSNNDDKAVNSTSDEDLRFASPLISPRNNDQASNSEAKSINSDDFRHLSATDNEEGTNLEDSIYEDGSPLSSVKTHSASTHAHTRKFIESWGKVKGTFLEFMQSQNSEIERLRQALKTQISSQEAQVVELMTTQKAMLSDFETRLHAKEVNLIKQTTLSIQEQTKLQLKDIELMEKDNEIKVWKQIREEQSHYYNQEIDTLYGLWKSKSQEMSSLLQNQEVPSDSESSW